MISDLHDWKTIFITKHYAPSDTKFMGECCIDVAFGKTETGADIVYRGEYEFNHSIIDWIEGFKDCLRILGQEFDIKITRLNDCEELEGE